MEPLCREQLRIGVFTASISTSKIKNKTERKGFNANYTINSSGYCDLTMPEDTYFRQNTAITILSVLIM